MNIYDLLETLRVDLFAGSEFSTNRRILLRDAILRACNGIPVHCLTDDELASYAYTAPPAQLAALDDLVRMSEAMGLYDEPSVTAPAADNPVYTSTEPIQLVFGFMDEEDA